MRAFVWEAEFMCEFTDGVYLGFLLGSLLGIFARFCVPNMLDEFVRGLLGKDGAEFGRGCVGNSVASVCGLCVGSVSGRLEREGSLWCNLCRRRRCL